MFRVKSISATDTALPRLRAELARVRPRHGDVVALVYLSRYMNKDGSVVEGFRPGYCAGPVQDGEFGDLWVLAQLKDGTEFRFMPLFKWQPEAAYVVDLASNYTFSISPA